VSGDDVYSRLQYRRLIAWPARIEREWPFLEEVLAPGPSRKILDLGCGTGEHSRFLAAHGFEVVGVDVSEAMIAEARREETVETPENPRYVVADLARIEAAAGEIGDGFGGAICIGNTLPHLREPEDLPAFCRGLRRLLRPGAPALVQILNYERIVALDERVLPVNVRPDPDGGHVVFLRLMELHDDGRVDFCPTSLRFRPDEAEPVQVMSSKRVPLRGWTRGDLDDALRDAGFERRDAWGGFQHETYEPLASRDLVLVAR